MANGVGVNSDMPRVLFLIDRLHSTEAGAEGAVQKLCRFLPDRGFRCSVATFWTGEAVEQRFPCAVRIFPLSRIYDWNALQQALAFHRFLRSEKFDIVHTFFSASDLWGGLVAKLSGCPVLVSSRRDMGILRSHKHTLIYRLANHLFDQVHAVSERVREFSIADDHLSADKVVTVHNGIDLEAIDGARPCDPTPWPTCDGEDPVIATVANIRFIKGIDILVKAAGLVLEQISHARFVVIGGEIQEPHYSSAVHATVRKLGIEDRVHFLGTRSDVFSLLKRCHAFCLPSRSEGMSNALLEAMACGLPCVATDVGGNAEAVSDGQTGFLAPSENPTALADRLLTLLCDRARARNMGQAARRVIETKFTVHHMVHRLAVLYGSLLAQKGVVTADIHSWRGSIPKQGTDVKFTPEV
ncbi:MAG TPA: glycosyltransferase [Candidatus Sulfotelmatobacter sp.]|nr:glycosyltransferase [Candidatus Sulfotelmatobacter sp.]